MYIAIGLVGLTCTCELYDIYHRNNSHTHTYISSPQLIPNSHVELYHSVATTKVDKWSVFESVFESYNFDQTRRFMDGLITIP